MNTILTNITHRKVLKKELMILQFKHQYVVLYNAPMSLSKSCATIKQQDPMLSKI